MPEALGQTFRTRLAAAEQKLQAISESTAGERYQQDSWTRKQVLGHLLDSAANNHVRFVVAGIQGQFGGPKYDQEGWVLAHNYANLPWTFLLEQWRVRNAMLAQVVVRIPEDKLSAECRIGDDAPVTLRFIIEDYLDHLDHHVADIAD